MKKKSVHPIVRHDKHSKGYWRAVEAISLPLVSEGIQPVIPARLISDLLGRRKTAGKMRNQRRS